MSMLTRHEIRVAVCGVKNSGKTVFLTSLADHLLNHNPSLNDGDDRCFNIEPYVVHDADIVDVHKSRDPIGNFAFQKYRTSFVENHWPEATTATTELVIDFLLVNTRRHHRNIFGRSFSKKRSVRLRFLDISGERLADFLMDGRDYKQWSDALLGNSRNHQKHLEDYVAEVEKALSGKVDNDAGTQIVLTAFKRALDVAQSPSNQRFTRFITPSSYRRPLDGTNPKEHPERCFSGIEGAEFAPLPQPLRERFPEIAKTFSANYRKYRDTIVRPIVGWMRRADKALFLVDMFDCMNGGLQAYNGAVAETEAALNAIRRGGILQSHVAGKNIRLIITKIDLADECGRGNLKNLAEQMFGKIAQSVTEFEKASDAFLLCAAVTTEEGIDGCERKKRAYPGISEDNEDIPGEGIPKKIPENIDLWKGRFPLKDINPAWFNLPANRPPKQSGLDMVARFILDI